LKNFILKRDDHFKGILDSFIHLFNQSYLVALNGVLNLLHNFLLLFINFAIFLFSLDLAEELAFVSHLLLEVINSFEVVLFVVSKQSTVWTYLFPVSCANDVHHNLMQRAYFIERGSCQMKWFIIEKGFSLLSIQLWRR